MDYDGRDMTGSRPGNAPAVDRHAFPNNRIPINEFGTRDAEAIDPEREVIVCLGCSHTYGFTRASNAYSKELERLLSGRFQVLNMGRRNYGLKLCIDWYEAFAARLSPTWCVVQVPLFCRQPLPGVQPDRPESYTMEEGAYKLLLGCTESQFWSYSNSLIESDLERLGGFLERLNLDGVRPIVLGYRTDKVECPPLTVAQERQYGKISGICRELSVPFVWGDDLSNSALGRRGMLFDKTHPNEAGNRWVAFRVGQHIDSELEPPRKLSIRNLAVDARGFLIRWSPSQMYRRFVKWRRRRRKRGSASIPTETYTMY